MEIYMFFNTLKYTYKLSTKQGGVVTHILCSTTNYSCDIGFTESEYSGDLQEISTFYESNPSDITTQNNSQIVLVKQANSYGLNKVDDKTFLLEGDLAQSAFTRNFRHIIYALSESLRQKLNMQCTTHAAAVSISNSNDAILILGDKGSGKTLTTYALCKYHNTELIGNDLVIVGSNAQNELYMHGGTTSFKFRECVVNSFFPELYFDKDKLDSMEKNEYESKAVVDARTLAIPVCNERKRIILAVRVNVHVSATSDFITRNLDKSTESLRLHENLARYIRGQTTPLMLEDGVISGYFPSFDCAEAQEIRNKIVSSLSKRILYLVAQSPQSAAALIMATYQNAERYIK
jgi:hypothetical protein